MRNILIAAAALAVLPGPVSAQVELSAVVGYRGGDASFLIEADAAGISCLLPPCVVAEARTPQGEALGLVLDVPIVSGWMFEVLLNRQDGNLRLTAELPVEAEQLGPESCGLTTLQVGLRRSWGDGELVPFVVAGVGAVRAETSARVLSPPIRAGEAGRRLGSKEALSASLGGGALLALDSRWGLRFEARGYWADLPEEIGGSLVQLEVSVGLSVRL